MYMDIPGYYYDAASKKYFKIEEGTGLPSKTKENRDALKETPQVARIKVYQMIAQRMAGQTFKSGVVPKPGRSERALADRVVVRSPTTIKKAVEMDEACILVLSMKTAICWAVGESEIQVPDVVLAETDLAPVFQAAHTAAVSENGRGVAVSDLGDGRKGCCLEIHQRNNPRWPDRNATLACLARIELGADRGWSLDWVLGTDTRKLLCSVDKRLVLHDLARLQAKQSWKLPGKIQVVRSLDANLAVFGLSSSSSGGSLGLIDLRVKWPVACGGKLGHGISATQIEFYNSSASPLILASGQNTVCVFDLRRSFGSAPVAHLSCPHQAGEFTGKVSVHANRTTLFAMSEATIPATVHTARSKRAFLLSYHLPTLQLMDADPAALSPGAQDIVGSTALDLYSVEKHSIRALRIEPAYFI